MRSFNAVLVRAFVLATVFTLHHSSAQTDGFAITERGADYNVVQTVTADNATNGYVELASGLNYQKNGQWTESTEQITLLAAGGAAAVQGQHQVYFPPDIYNGVLEVVTPDGRHLYSRPLGVSYDDGSNSVFIATLKSSQGYLTSSNQVTYRDAFTDFKADLVCTYRREGFECDLVFRQQPPTPGDYGLDASSSTLQMITEFFNTQDPQQIPAAYDEWFGLQDSALKFGKLTMTQGKAFAVKSQNPQTPDASTETPVYKSWLHLAGRTFLIEELPVEYLADDLNTLPLAASIQKPEAGSQKFASCNRTFPPAHELVASTNQILVAAIDFNQEPGVVLDYQTINTSQTNYTFKGDTTYYLSGSVNLSGTTIFEGGTVIKYAAGKAINIVSPGIAQTTSSPYRPVVFTAKDDNSIGEIISGSSGSPSGYYASPALNLQTAGNPALQYVRFTWAQTAVSLGSDLALNLAHVQFVNCNYAVGLADTYSLNLDLKNVLFSHVQTPFDMFTMLGGATITAQQATIDSCAALVREGYTGAYALNFTNCILANVTTTGWSGSPDGHLFGNHNGAYNNGWTGSSLDIYANGNPFAVAGAGNYYLNVSSGLKGVGTKVIDPVLAAALATKTTWPPTMRGSGYVLSGTVWWPTVERDTDTPDLGYHYDPLDYLVTGQYLGGNLTLTNGVAVGIYGSYGFQNGTLTSFGGPLNHNHLGLYSAVQEQPQLPWSSIGNASSMALLSATTTPSLNWHFTDLSLAGGAKFCNNNNPVALSVMDCDWLAVQMTPSTGSAVALAQNYTNNLLNRCYFQYGYCGGTKYKIGFYNNLLLNSSLYIGFFCDASIVTSLTVINNLFDGGYFTYANYPTPPVISNNGFYQTFVTSYGANAKVISQLDFQPGPLGAYYYPLTGGGLSQLFDAGSMTSANAGLTGYTVRPDQTTDTGLVDIGYHYPAGIGSAGTDFWMAFCNGIVDNWDANEMSLYITCPVAATGTITIPGLGSTYDQSFSVAPGTATQVTIPWEAMILNYGSVEGKGVHLTASQPVAVYAVYYYQQASTAFTVYPTPMLGTNYGVMAYTGAGGPSSANSQFSIVATEDNTTVKITPSPTANLANVSGTPPYQVTLNQGRTYQLKSINSDDDVTGTLIASDKPIGVFAGAQGAFVPYGTPTVNPLIQEQLPVITWGKQALALPFATRIGGDTYRVLAANDGTEVTTNGIVWGANFSAGEFREAIIDGPVEFKGSKPIQVAQFANSTTVDSQINSDPSEVLLSPIDSYLTSYIVTTPSDPNPTSPYFTSYLNIIVDGTAIAATLRDGQPISASSFQPIGSSGYYGAQVPVAVGTHTVSSSKPVSVQVYGFGKADAYGYFGGMSIWLNR